MSRTVYFIKTKRLILRCWQNSDAPLLKTAIDESLEHLRPWLPWVGNESKSLLHYVNQLQHFRCCFDVGHDYTYGVFDSDQSQVLGGCGLHPRIGNNAYEIGFWIHKNHTNQGLGTEIAAVLSKVALEVYRAHRVEIHCSSKNVPTVSISKKLGFAHKLTVPHGLLSSDGNLHNLMVWTLFSDAYTETLGSGNHIKIYDAKGRAVSF